MDADICLETGRWKPPNLHARCVRYVAQASSLQVLDSSRVQSAKPSPPKFFCARLHVVVIIDQ